MFNAEKFIEEIVTKLKKDITGKALIAFSGGVDSTVCAALVNKAIGKQLIAVHVDTGYMRKNESKDVKKLMEKMKLNKIQKLFLVLWIPCLLFMLMMVSSRVGMTFTETSADLYAQLEPVVIGWDGTIAMLIIGIILTIAILDGLKDRPKKEHK